MQRLNATEPYADVLTLPECCELAVRTGRNEDYLFVLNYSDKQQEIWLNRRMKNVFTNQESQGTQQLLPYEAVVYKMLI